MRATLACAKAYSQKKIRQENVGNIGLFQLGQQRYPFRKEDMNDVVAAEPALPPAVAREERKEELPQIPSSMPAQNSSQPAQDMSRKDKLLQEYSDGLGYEPKAYEGGVGHLLLSNLVEDDQEKRDSANHFACGKCTFVVVAPRECKQCSHLFCADCIEDESCLKCGGELT